MAILSLSLSFLLLLNLCEQTKKIHLAAAAATAVAAATIAGGLVGLLLLAKEEGVCSLHSMSIKKKAEFYYLIKCPRQIFTTSNSESFTN